MIEIHFLPKPSYCPRMEQTFADLHRAITQVSPYPWRVRTVAGYLLGLLGWLATGFMLGVGMTIGQVLAG